MPSTLLDTSTSDEDVDVVGDDDDEVGGRRGEGLGSAVGGRGTVWSGG